MCTQFKILRHPEVDEALRTLPAQLVDSLEDFEQALKNDEDLSRFTHTKPFSAGDALGNRTGIRHYHLLPCRPDCYLVWLVRNVDSAFILDVSLHPTAKEFTSSEIEETLYSRFAELCPELAAYRLLGSYRYAFTVRNKDKYGARTAESIPYVVPMRTQKSDFLPLGQLGNLTEGRNRIGVVIGTFEIPTVQIPDAAMQCIDSEEHPEWESLTLNIGGWACHSGIIRKETEQVILFFCPLHNVIMQVGTRCDPLVVALSDKEYFRIFDYYRTKFYQVDEKDQGLNEIVDRLIEHFPLYRP